MIKEDIKNRKVLFIIDTLQGSGAERSLVEIALHFSSYVPVFVHLYKGEMLKPLLEKKGVKVYSLNISAKYGFKEAVKELNSIYKIENPDIVHSTLFRADMVSRRMKKRFPQIPLVGSFVNNSYTRLRYKNKSLPMKMKLWLAYKLDKISAKKVDFFISNSETIKAAEGCALNIADNKIQVIYRGRDLQKYNKINADELRRLKSELAIEGKNVLLNVSRLIERKAQLDIIRCLPEVLKNFPNTVLFIAGHGDYKVVLEKEITKLNLQHHVQLLGRRQDIPELLQLSNLFIYPSYAEGLPGALIEAMMAEKIIIASDIGENLECVNQDSAFIFKRGNISELIHYINYALGNLSKVQSKGITARKQAAEKFEISTIAEKYELVYEKQLKEK